MNDVVPWKPIREIRDNEFKVIILVIEIIILIKINKFPLISYITHIHQKGLWQRVRQRNNVSIKIWLSLSSYTCMNYFINFVLTCEFKPFKQMFKRRKRRWDFVPLLYQKTIKMWIGHYSVNVLYSNMAKRYIKDRGVKNYFNCFIFRFPLFIFVIIIIIILMIGQSAYICTVCFYY